jgi:hypothetical protein
VKTVAAIVVLCAVLAGSVAAGWWGMNYYAVGEVGTPAHAGVISQGRPEECTNLNFQVRPKEYETRTVMLADGDIVRGTFEVDGGLGRVNIFLRVQTPQGQDILSSPKTDNYDFTFPARMDGEYVFFFDNRYSLFTSKAIGLYYCVERAGVRPAP